MLTSALALLACSRTTDVYVGSDLIHAPAVVDDPSPTPAEMQPSGGALDGSLPSAGAVSPPPAAVDAGPSGCAQGFADCDGNASNACETDITNDVAHCGGCDIACETADCVCVDGERMLECAAQRADCDGDPSNGCETDLTSDAQHCGQCARPCPADGPGVAGASCTAGACVLVCQFPMLRGDCDDDLDNGCETDLFHDENNCAMCGRRCTACLDGRCL